MVIVLRVTMLTERQRVMAYTPGRTATPIVVTGSKERKMVAGFGERRTGTPTKVIGPRTNPTAGESTSGQVVMSMRATGSTALSKERAWKSMRTGRVMLEISKTTIHTGLANIPTKTKQST
jgi:hypothetical protein